ncbi:hypothetical protein [Phenylobacterium montanum]|uniref:Uncharacterized protein n=1 Tax=Phenylobacterium montanum TaxID=2823693 RepID=A0A975G4Q0_9CAUL|nr:hypothetical protein [Caulobacter sp. S6]QUD89996.1 hypothetical protein KCG34_09090 [Caulobacter sp. S6]
MSIIYNFFAAPDELAEIWNWISSRDGVRLLEASSQPDAPNREFSSFPIDELKAEGWVSVVAWPSVVGGQPRRREVTFGPGAVSKGKGRTELVSPAFLAIKGLRPPRENQIGPAELVYETEKSAQRSGRYSDEQLAEVDWKVFQKFISLVQRHIEGIAAAKWRAHPVLPGIAQELKSTSKVLWLWGDEGTIS